MLGIVILNYNTWKETRNLVQSIEKSSDSKYRIYIVDNVSSEQIPIMDQEFYSNKENIILLYSEKNNGYAAGNNVGIRRALEDNCDFIMICNSDVLFVDNSIDKMLNAFNYLESPGIVGPTLYDNDGNLRKFHMLCKLNATGKLQLLLAKTPLKFFSFNFDKKFFRDCELDIPLKVFGVLGCCFVMSRECAEYVYPWDENTFLYEEENILGCQLENSKYNVYIIPDTHVIHYGEVSTQKTMSKFSYKCFINSEQYYLKKYIETPWLGRRLLYLIRILIEVVR